ncbi:ATP synthase F1 subunit delta [Nafulsella turpanensis]|uniref:ATP synthase F1 subunit delta n=1 Tax=Nafulsella turpanensis TaxID=1265690 RepID=UPI00034DCAAA|nr:ATP synthase F1 subunit delta [Nafulsella turpanensis]
MSEIRVASRYAKSLIELAKEKGVLEEVHNDMQLFSQTVESNRDLYLMLKNPIMGNDKKYAVLKAIFGDKVTEMTNAFFKIVSRKNREENLPAVAKEFHARYNIEKGIVAAEVTTTFPLTDEMRKEFRAIVEKISGKKAELSEKVDKSLIGGYVLKVGDRQIDESIQSRLVDLKSKFSHNPYIKEF